YGWNHSHTGLFKQAACAIEVDYTVENENHGKYWIELFHNLHKLMQLAVAEAIPDQVTNHNAAHARLSHLQHMLAEALAVVGDSGGILAQSLAASSFKDGTRVAGTSPALVRQMCETNAAALVDALDEALILLADARDNLAADPADISHLADAGYRART